MKAKLDENLPLQIASSLRGLGHDVHTMAEEGISGCNDADLWRAAQREGRVLITQRSRFLRCAEIRAWHPSPDSSDQTPIARSAQARGTLGRSLPRRSCQHMDPVLCRRLRSKSPRAQTPELSPA